MVEHSTVAQTHKVGLLRLEKDLNMFQHKNVNQRFWTGQPGCELEKVQSS